MEPAVSLFADRFVEPVVEEDSVARETPVSPCEAVAVNRVFRTAEGGVVPSVFSPLLSNALRACGDGSFTIGDKFPKS